MDAVHREQAQVGIVNTAVVKIDDRSAVRLCDSLDLRVEISNRISVQIHGGSAGISIQITTLQQGAAVDEMCIRDRSQSSVRASTTSAWFWRTSEL